ncbi:MAG: hypothetical protein RIQ93_2288 [Verrucomicrobiota bacterium]|jgi:hypothetical protein
MKDSEFIELLNLYLDQEISPADATRLEAEVLGNTARREVYQQYCRMQKGCKLLAQDFVVEPAAGNRKVVEFTPAAAPRRKALVVAGALTAAAASLAVIFTSRYRVNPTNLSTAAAALAAPSAVTASVVASQNGSDKASTSRSLGPGVSRMLNSPLALGRRPETAPSLLVAGDHSGKQFEWMKTLQLPPVQRVPLEQLRFEAKSPLQSDSRTYDSGHPPQDTIEMTAFRFQR